MWLLFNVNSVLLILLDKYIKTHKQKGISMGNYLFNEKVMKVMEVMEAMDESSTEVSGEGQDKTLSAIQLATDLYNHVEEAKDGFLNFIKWLQETSRTDQEIAEYLQPAGGLLFDAFKDGILLNVDTPEEAHEMEHEMEPGPAPLPGPIHPDEYIR